MSVMMVMKWDGVTPGQYDKMRKSLHMDENPPKGLVSHTAGFSDNAIRVTDIWESADDFNNYTNAYLMPAAIEAELTGQPQVEIIPVHATWPLV